MDFFEISEFLGPGFERGSPRKGLFWGSVFFRAFLEEFCEIWLFLIFRLFPGYFFVKIVSHERIVEIKKNAFVGARQILNFPFFHLFQKLPLLDKLFL